MSGVIREEFFKGKKIYIHDFSMLSGEELLKAIPALARETLSKPDKAQLIVLDVTAGKVNSEAAMSFKKAAAAIRPVIKKSAIVGVTPLQKIILNSVNMVSNLGITPFNTMKEAKEWLVKE